MLANFLDLKIFDALHDLANKENKAAVVLLEEYQKQDFETKLGDAERLKDINEDKHQQAQLDVDRVEGELQQLTDTLVNYNKQLQPCNADGLDINRLHKDLQLSQDRENELSDLIVQAQNNIRETESNLQQITNELTQHKSTFDAELYKTYLAKTQGGRLSPLQKVFASVMQQTNQKYKVIWTIEQVDAFIASVSKRSG